MMQTADFENVKGKLLAIGGDNVMTTPVPHIGFILKRRWVFPITDRKRLKGLQYQPNQNVALHHLVRLHFGRGGTLDIAVGYGLHDGVWWPHSWLWDGERVLETCVNHNVYYGVVLDDAEASSFILQAVRRIMPAASGACRPELSHAGRQDSAVHRLREQAWPSTSMPF